MKPCPFFHLRHWLTGEGYSKDCPPRPVVLECIPSRSGMSMAVYDRGVRIFTINGCGFDRVGTALGDFLGELFQPELAQLAAAGYDATHHVAGASFRAVNMAEPWAETQDWHVALEGACGIESMIQVADAIGLSVHLSESKAGTLILIQKKGV